MLVHDTIPKDVENGRSIGQLTTRGRNLKQAPSGLREWMRLANLIPVGTDLPDLADLADTEPTWSAVLERIAGLEGPLRRELLNFAPPSSGKWAESLRLTKILWHYNRILTAHRVLYAIARTGDEALTAFEGLVSTLRYADLRYIRICRYKKCRKLFYAGKANQWGCTPQHSAAIYKAKKRRDDKANREASDRLKILRTVQKGAQKIASITLNTGLSTVKVKQLVMELLRSGDLDEVAKGRYRLTSKGRARLKAG